MAKVMFSEDFFINDSCFSSLILEMMHKHKALLAEKLQEAEKLHEIRSGFDPDTLFRLIMGPVRLLIKQWSISGNKFDLENSGKLLLETLEELLKYETENNRNPNK